MMCIACELSFTWLDDLESRDLNGPDGRAAPPLPFASAKPASTPTEPSAAATETNKFSCDDPTAG